MKKFTWQYVKKEKREERRLRHNHKKGRMKGLWEMCRGGWVPEQKKDWFNIYIQQRTQWALSLSYTHTHGCVSSVHVYVKTDGRFQSAQREEWRQSADCFCVWCYVVLMSCAITCPWFDGSNSLHFSQGQSLAMAPNIIIALLLLMLLQKKSGARIKLNIHVPSPGLFLSL